MREWSVDNVLRSISEDIEDQDVFADPEPYLNATFTQLLDEGGEGLIAQAIESEFAPMTVLSVNTDENYVIMSNFPGYGEYDDNILARRKFKVPFSIDQVVLNWGVTQLMPAIRGLEIERQQGTLRPEQHPLFFEATSPFTGEKTRDWGWQATVIPVAGASSGDVEGLDDVDEFFTGTDMWRVTITNKHYPGKELVGTVGWNYGDLVGHMPKVEDVERNDFPLINHDFARRLVWAVYWASEEEGEGRGSVEPFVIDQGNLLQVDNSGIVVLKHINDPSEIEKKYPHKPPGWSSVGTHTYGEAAGNREMVTINGKPFIGMPAGGFANLVMNTYHVSPTNHYEAPEDITEAYDLFSYWGPTLNITDYEEQYFGHLPEPEPKPVSASTDLDDVDEFEEDDPEVELQRQEDAERHAARAGMDIMRKDFTTLDKPGFEVIYIGAYGTGPTVRPYVVVGRKKATMTEGLDDKDEFGHIGLQAIYRKETRVQPQPVAGWSADEVKMIIVYENGAKAYWYYNNSTDPSVSVLKLVSEEGSYGFKGLAPDNVPDWFSLYYDGFEAAHGHAAIKPLTPELEREFDTIWHDNTTLEEPPPIEEGLDDKDEFVAHEMIPVDATIIYNPQEIMRPAIDVIEIAKMIVVEHGYMPGTFTSTSSAGSQDEVRIFGTLEVDDQLVQWLEDEGGYIEMSSVGVGGILRKYGNITLVLENEDAKLRAWGIDA